MLAVLIFLFGALTMGSDGQTHCCFSPQWESPTRILEGYYVPAMNVTGSVTGLDRVSYDYINQRIAANLSIFTNGKFIQTKAIQDYAGKKQYVINGTSCTSSNLIGEIAKNCIPENAVWRGTTYYGAGNSKLHFDAWSFQINKTDVFMTTSREDCLPIAESFTGTLGSGADGLAILTYTSTTVGIKDPSVFNPPTDCVHSDVVLPGNVFGSIIGRM